MDNLEFQNMDKKEQILEIIRTINSNDMVNVLTFNQLTGISMSILEYIASDGDMKINAILQDDRVATIDYTKLEALSIDEETVLLAERNNVVIFTKKEDLNSLDIQKILNDIL
ncbi:hypothetical protein [Peptacetobacter sp.]|uniref:hypothetical protein n=1 Tax=Peptacetobacter sp. TaxID=2991975 RepID=UPI00260A7998|nr:hypothetical protein [Peptacetobacter sp.]